MRGSYYAARGTMIASLIGPDWDGKRIPEAMRCGTPGASSPLLQIQCIPEGAIALIIEFNDLDFEPLSRDGGHGIIGYRLGAGLQEFIASPIPELSCTGLPDGVWIFANNRGRYPTGYRAPCGGQTKANRYEATIKAAADLEGASVLAQTKLFLGVLK